VIVIRAAFLMGSQAIAAATLVGVVYYLCAILAAYLSYQLMFGRTIKTYIAQQTRSERDTPRVSGIRDRMTLARGASGARGELYAGLPVGLFGFDVLADRLATLRGDFFPDLPAERPARGPSVAVG
jgi:hypothetical protein